MSHLKIDIYGGKEAGKTTLARIIYDFLKNKNADIEVSEANACPLATERFYKEYPITEDYDYKDYKIEMSVYEE